MHRRPPSRRSPVAGTITVLSVLAASAVAAGCGGPGGAANHAATATTFRIDSVTPQALATIVDQSNTAAVLTVSGKGAGALASCTTAWARVRAAVAARDRRTVADIDAGLASLGAALRIRNSGAAADAASGIAAAAARYTRLYP